jgi:hypothetical protein
MQFFTPPSTPQGIPSTNPQPRLPSKGPHLPVSPFLDELGSLQPTQLGDVQFPSESFNEKGSHSLVAHLYPNLNNARVENTGFNPRQWTIVGILTNNIYPAKNETWGSGILYPHVWNQLKALLETTTSQILIHPEIGQVNVKVQDYDYTLHADKPRDGIIVVMKFIECINDSVTLKQSNSNLSSSSLSLLSKSANSLDNAIAKPFNDPRLAPPGVSLQGLFTQTAGYIRNLVNTPGMVHTSLNAQVLGLTSTVGVGGAVGNVVNTPSNIYDTTIGLVSLNKQTIVGFRPVVNAVQNDRALFSPQVEQSFNPTNPTGNSTTNIPPGGASQIIQSYQRTIVYPIPQLGALMQAYFSMTTTANKGPNTIIEKTILFNQKLFNYYAALQNYQTSEIQQALLQYTAALVALQDPTNLNSNLMSFVNPVPITFMDASQQTGNDIDTIMTLNPNLSKLIIIPANSNIYYNNG